MNKTLFILTVAALGFALPVHAKGDFNAGKTKSASCAACHGADGVSQISAFPTLAGQYRDYLYHVLKDYKSGKRKNPIMTEQVRALSNQDMQDLAMYFSKQKGLTQK